MNRAICWLFIYLTITITVPLHGQDCGFKQKCNALNRLPSAMTWTFAVSGDSRNCGDVIMPAIAQDALKYAPLFYWHLGDFRIRVVLKDDDMRCSSLQDENDRACKISFGSYMKGGAWADFQRNQICPFGQTPFVVGIGNHEMVRHINRDDFVKAFSCWLDAPLIRAQRLKDNKDDIKPPTYYHWVMQGIDFINLDNAGTDGVGNFSPWGNKNLSFTNAQVMWLERILARDKADTSIKALVVGMHAALPDSFSAAHSMSDSPKGVKSGRRVYNALWDFHDSTHKPVYLLASHSHYYMENIYNTKFWKGKVLPGWIVGTAGARRYALPKDRDGSKNAKTNIYGYILATVNPDGANDGTIKFEFHSIEKDKIPKETTGRFTSKFISWCFEENSACKKGNPQCEPDELNKPSDYSQ